MALFRSLRARVLFWISVALTLLFAMTVAALDTTFRQTADSARRELLDVQFLGLVGLAEPTEQQTLGLPNDAINQQFGVADSGLYGVLRDREGRALWKSLSLLDRDLPAGDLPLPGERRIVTLDVPGLPPLEALIAGIEWQFDDGQVKPFVLGVAVSLEPYHERQSAFRRGLIIWFAVITGVMLLVLTLLLRVVLRPLRTLEQQVREVEAGRRLRLEGDFPAEVTPLAGNLNALIESERGRLTRYRNMLDDLAHSLKTPLAAMRSLLGELAGAEHARDALEREIERMDQRVSYQLRRARASGATGLGAEPVPLGPAVADLKATLDKVYRDKGVHCTTRVAPDALFHGDPGDLFELLGNLLDNAYKYCSRRVDVVVEPQGERLVVKVGDDGPGIGTDSVGQLLERGVRADETTPGQGIGLAVVRETVGLHGGRLDVRRSPLGGAEVVVVIGRAGFVF